MQIVIIETCFALFSDRIQYYKKRRAPEKKQKARVRPSRVGERSVIEETSGLWSVNKADQQGNKAGVWSWDIIDWLAPLSGSVRAAEQAPVEKGHRGRAGFFFGDLSVSCQWAWDLHSTQSIYLHTFNVPICLRSLCTHSSACLFYHLLSRLPLLLPICCFLFPFSYPLLTTIITLRPPALLSSSRPSLLPSILQMLVGSRTISRGSWRPAAPSLWSLPAIVPGLTAAWLLQSINCTHTGLITTEHRPAPASSMGETPETGAHAWIQVTLGYLWVFPQRCPVIVL